MNDSWVPAMNALNASINSATTAVATAGTYKADREFAHKEAKIARDWQEQIYQKYQSPQAQVNQLKAAGINPYLDGSVDSRSVGSGATASQPASLVPDYGSIGDSIMAALSAKRMMSEIDSIDESTRSTYLDNVKKQFDNGNLQEVYDYNIAQLKADLDQKKLSRTEYDVRVKALQLAYKQAKDADDQGVNPIVDTHNSITATIAYTNAKTLSENLLRLPRKVQIEADISLKKLSYELDDKYGRALMSTNFAIQNEALNKMKYEFQEYVDNRQFRDKLIKAGASEAEANALIAESKATVDSIDADWLVEMMRGTDSGDNITDPLGMFFYAILNPGGFGLNLFGK